MTKMASLIAKVAGKFLPPSQDLDDAGFTSLRIVRLSNVILAFYSLSTHTYIVQHSMDIDH